MADERCDNLEFAPLFIALTYLDLHKVYVDDMSYNYGHGHAYRALGVNPEVGAVIIVRPDQCKLLQQMLQNSSRISLWLRCKVCTLTA